MILQSFSDGTSESLLLYGVFGSGKTTQAAEVVKSLAQESGKPALAYVTDWGSSAPLHALADQGLLAVEHFRYGTDPFVWLDAAVQGSRFANGKWVKLGKDQYCAVLMESLSGMGDLILHALGKQTAAGQGTDAMKAPQLIIASEGGPIKIAANSPTHYGMAQKHLLEKVWQSQLLPMPIIWTAHEDVASPAKRDEQGNLRAEVAVGPGILGMVGPLVAGHALTMHLGKYFAYTFRLRQEVSSAGTEHVLYTGRHKDGFYEALATNRAPLGSKLPLIYKPADVVKALQDIQKARVGKG